jgi:glutamyl-tRNA synthetase
MSAFTTVRVRFAPSPTGYLHVGGLRTALYNYLFARRSGGVFVLRIEDTDRTRYVEGAVDNLIDTLRWCGLQYDEGPGTGGASGPYVQSERLETYAAHIRELINAGKAYFCFCTPERLQELRNRQHELKEQTKYDKRCLRLPQDEVQEHFRRKVPHVVRLNIEPGRIISVEDVIRGHIEFDSNLMDDQVLLKSDGYPTYHLANVVDDHLMCITHVIRGEEWLPSTPKHVLLYDAFGWEKPVFAHLPLLLNPDKSKLSKRQGDVAVEDYRAKGYLNEALVNFVALLGWNPGDEREFFLLDDLIEQFSIDGVNKAGAIFNIEKLNWLNFEHLRKKSDFEVLQLLKEELARSRYAAVAFEDSYLLKIIQAMRPRVTFIKDFLEKSPYFFEPPAEYDPEVVKKRWHTQTPAQLRALAAEFSRLEHPTNEGFEQALETAARALQISNGDLIHAVRLATSGVGGGPGVYDILSILGKEETLKRIGKAIERIHL